MDLVTPLVTPLTYEGLIDEILGIQNGFVKVDPAILDDGSGANKPKPEEPGKKWVPLPLNSNDSLYDEARDYNVERLWSYLQVR